RQRRARRTPVAPRRVPAAPRRPRDVPSARAAPRRPVPHARRRRHHLTAQRAAGRARARGGDTSVSDDTTIRDALDAADAVFRASPLRDRVAAHKPIGPLTTYRAGGPAARFVVVESTDELLVVAEAAEAGGLPVLVV